VVRAREIIGLSVWGFRLCLVIIKNSICWNTNNFELLNFRFCLLEIKFYPKKKNLENCLFKSIGFYLSIRRSQYQSSMS
jgi:hypothetical protein